MRFEVPKIWINQKFYLCKVRFWLSFVLLSLCGRKVSAKNTGLISFKLTQRLNFRPEKD